MRLLKQSTAYDLAVLMVDSVDHISGKTGLTLTIAASKNVTAFASITPTVTELSYGWYKVALTASDLDTIGDLAIHISATGADPQDVLMQIRSVTTDELVRSTTPANTLDVSTSGEAGLDFDNIKVATGATTLSNITVPVVTSVTNDIGVTQAGADKVWSSTARTLTSFGTLVNDVATAVWAATTRTLSGFGTLVSDIWANPTRTLSGFSFTVATNSDTNVTAIKAKTDNLPINPASQTNLDVAVSTRLAGATYVAPPSAADVAAAVWAATTRTLTSFGTLTSDVATAVWAATTRTLSGFGTLVSDVADAVWSYLTRTLTSSGSGGATAQEIWEYTGRTLTGFSFTVATNSDTNVTAIKAKTDNLPINPASQTNLDVAVSTRLSGATYVAPPTATDVATAVWAATTRTLSGFGTLVSDVASAVWAYVTRTLTAGGTGGATAQEIWEYNGRTLTGFSFTVATNSDTNVSAIKAKTDNLPINPASQTNLDVAVSTRLAEAAYVAPPTAADVATAVWAATTRTLSGFGTLVSDVASAVWAYVTRVLTSSTGGSGATAQEVWEYTNRLLTDPRMDNLDSPISGIATSLTGMAVDYVGPMLEGGNVQIVVGDDYLIDDGRALSWVFTELPDLIGATILFKCGDVTATAILDGLTIRAELDSEETALLKGSHPFTLRATLPNASRITLLAGSVIGR